MSDIFHERIPEDLISETFRVMGKDGQHQFQVFTKRSKRLAVMNEQLSWSANIWMGVTAKQNCGHAKGGRLLDGRIWNEMPNGNPLLD